MSKHRRRPWPSVHPTHRHSAAAFWSWASPWLLLLAGTAVYLNSFSGQFIFDDIPEIAENPLLRSWGDLPALLAGKDRPLVYLSFAGNYAVSGLKVWSYHLGNLLIHLAAGLTLWGIIRRSLRLSRIPPVLREHAAGLSLAMALLWMAHPLQTESVTYLFQRAEAAGGLFYFLTFYGALRFLTEERRLFAVGAWVACLTGVFIKPTIVTAPVLVLLYDVAVMGSSWEALRRRWIFYAGLFLTWIPLGLVVAQISGQAPAGVTWWEYALAQPEVLLHYVRLTFWPDPLVLDYQWPAAVWSLRLLPSLTVIGAVLAVTAYGIFRRALWAFPAAAFFLTQAPTSSVLPLNDVAFEHRMYMPLAGVIVLSVSSVWMGLQRLRSTAIRRGIAAALVVITSIALGARTVARNRDYNDREEMWAQVVRLRPGNPRGHANYGLCLLERGRSLSARTEFEKALTLKPDYPEVYYNLSAMALHDGHPQEAWDLLQKAVTYRPEYAAAYVRLGELAASRGNLAEARRFFTKARSLDAHRPDVMFNLGVVTLLENRDPSRPGRLNGLREALAIFREMTRRQPDSAESYYYLGLAHGELGEGPQAREAFETAVRLDPDHRAGRFNLALRLKAEGRMREAVEQLQETLRRDPGFAAARRALARWTKPAGEEE